MGCGHSALRLPAGRHERRDAGLAAPVVRVAAQRREQVRTEGDVRPAAATLVRIPAAGTENDDTNPPRVAPRNLYDVAIGDDNLFKGDRYKWSAQLTVINFTNKYALYNFLSTFSGTHYVSPRTVTGEIGFHF